MTVDNVEEYLGKKGEKLAAKALTPPSKKCCHELGISEDLAHEEAYYYYSLIGVLRWILELGCADICVEVSMMSSHLALPRRVHLDEVLHILVYLKGHTNSEIVYNPNRIEFERSEFPRNLLELFYIHPGWL